MPKPELTLRLTLCLPGYDRGPPPVVRCGFFAVLLHPKGAAATIEEVEQRSQAREVRAYRALESAREALADASGQIQEKDQRIAELSRQLPGAAKAAEQRDGAPGGVVPSSINRELPKLDAAPGGGSHFAERG